jgi:hypothetical protein
MTTVTTERSEIRALTADEVRVVSGGKTPTPAGPIPVPYPNTYSFVFPRVAVRWS